MILLGVIGPIGMIFLILLSITSIIKNQTRILEKKLSKLYKEINLKEQDMGQFKQFIANLNKVVNN